MDYTLKKPEVYQLSEAFSDTVGDIVMDWDNFRKDTIGKKIARPADSISANIAEGYGRY
jgi:four helix bundle protein